MSKTDNFFDDLFPDSAVIGKPKDQPESAFGGDPAKNPVNFMSDEEYEKYLRDQLEHENRGKSDNNTRRSRDSKYLSDMENIFERPYL